MAQVQGSTRVRTRRSTWRVEVPNVAALAELVVTSIGVALITGVDVTVNGPVRPNGWVGRPDVAGITSVAVERTPRKTQVHLSVEPERDAAALLAAVLRMLSPVRSVPGTFVGALDEHASVLAPSVRDIFTNDVHVHLRRADTMFLGDGSSVADGVAERIVTIQPDRTWIIDDEPASVWVDPAIHRPLGRRSDAALQVGTAPTSDDLDVTQIEALRETTAVRGVVSAKVCAQLHAAGVLLESELPSDTDPLHLQVASVRERRDALRRFSPDGALDNWPTVSAVVLTHRATFLPQLVRQLRGLTYPRLQVVVGMHGSVGELGGLVDELRELPFETVITNIPGELPFGAAMQVASSRAEGSLLTKMDDDDYYGPEHIWDLVLAHRYSGAQVVGKALDWIHLADQDSTVFRPTYDAEKYARFVAGGTIMIDSGTLAEVGGWRPVPKSIDRALLDSVRLAGGLIYRTHGLGYIYVRRGDGHTAQVQAEHFQTKTHSEYPGLLTHAEFGTDG